jgi:conjugal transfer pilus assembly protein TraU
MLNLNRFCLLIGLLISINAFGQSTDSSSTKSTTGVSGLLCPNADIWGEQMITGVCWTCLFPVRMFGDVTSFGGDDSDVPDGAATTPVCACKGKDELPSIGFTAGAWLPARLVEVVRKPYCSPSLGGVSLNNGIRLWGGAKETDQGSADKSFYNYHYWAFPLYEMLDLLVQVNCDPDGMKGMDLMYLSEVDPTWNVDELAFFINPEAVLFANPLAMTACAADGILATASKPIQSMWWCAGTWGNLYPFTGNIASDASGPRDTSLLVTRVLASLHRKGLAQKTYGDDALCQGTIYPMVPKQQYKMSMMFPVPESQGPTSSMTKNCCHNIGESTFLWGDWRTIPGTGEDYVYMLWRYTDCCVTPH